MSRGLRFRGNSLERLSSYQGCMRCEGIRDRPLAGYRAALIWHLQASCHGLIGLPSKLVIHA